MAAIVSVTNGVTAWDQAHVNQYADTFNNVLGVTSTTADALGRLVIPRGTVNPGSPSNGMLFLRTDLGGDGRLQRYNGTVWVPYLPLRQVVKSAELTGEVIISSTSYTDITGLSVSITTTGGRLLIIMVPGTVAADTGDCYVDGGTGGCQFFIAALVATQQLNGISQGNSTNQTWHFTPGAFSWDYKPTAGTYTVKLQGKLKFASSGNLHIGNSATPTNTGPALMVLEYGD